MPEGLDARLDYAKYRLERAKEDLDAACMLLENGSYRIANNRAYYAIFHAMRAVLAFDNFDSSKHSGVIAEFRRRYIKEGIFSKEMSQMIGSAFIIRNASDYDDMFVASKGETEQQVRNAKYILKKVEEYLDGLGSKAKSPENDVPEEK